jgi:solute:Na+ symporter, SSS family
MAELANKTSGPLARLLVSIIILITWTGISAAQFVALSSILSSLTGLSGNVSVAIGSLFIILYTLIGGQKTVLKTDFFQFGILAISIVIAVFWLWFGKTPIAAPQITLFTEKFGPLNLLYYIVVMGGSYFICPMMFSRILSTDTAENARKSSFLSGFGMLIFAFTLTFIGLWVKAAAFDSNGMDPLNAIARTALPGALGVALIFGLLSAILSTADTVLLTASSVMQNDIIKKPSVAMVRIWTVLIGGIAAFVALFERDIIGLLMKTYNGYTAGLVPSLFIALMYAKFEKGESKVKPCSLLFAIAIVGGYALGMAGSFAPEGPISMILPLAGMVFSATLALLAYSPRFRKN